MIPKSFAVRFLSPDVSSSVRLIMISSISRRGVPTGIVIECGDVSSPRPLPASSSTCGGRSFDWITGVAAKITARSTAF